VISASGTSVLRSAPVSLAEHARNARDPANDDNKVAFERSAMRIDPPHIERPRAACRRSVFRRFPTKRRASYGFESSTEEAKKRAWGDRRRCRATIAYRRRQEAFDRLLPGDSARSTRRTLASEWRTGFVDHERASPRRDETGRNGTRRDETGRDVTAR
jgi:hypothetical protein